MIFSPTLLHYLRRFASLLILLVACALAVEATAQTNANRVPANRWLLIVETSRGMESRAESAQIVAANLVASGMNGQMHPGDTIGLWTFNDKLYSGQFPLQQWTPETSRSVGGHIYQYLQTQKNQKQSHLEKVIPEMEAVIQASDFITIVLVTDGVSQMRGTPFDAKINASYKEWQDQQKKSEMPFLTVLRAKEGVITHGFVNTPPFPLEFPPLPEELMIPPVAETKPAVVEKPKPAVVPSLILSGKKKTPPPVEAESPAPVETSKPETVPANPPSKMDSVPTAEVKPDAVPSANPPTETVVKKAASENAPPTSNPAPQSQESIAPLAKAEVSARSEAQPAPTGVGAPVPIESAITVQAEPIWKQKGFWIAASAIFGLTLLGTFLVLRRPRHSSQASLITRSLDRDRK